MNKCEIAFVIIYRLDDNLQPSKCVDIMVKNFIDWLRHGPINQGLATPQYQ